MAGKRSPPLQGGLESLDWVVDSGYNPAVYFAHLGVEGLEVSMIVMLSVMLLSRLFVPDLETYASPRRRTPKLSQARRNVVTRQKGCTQPIRKTHWTSSTILIRRRVWIAKTRPSSRCCLLRKIDGITRRSSMLEGLLYNRTIIKEL